MGYKLTLTSGERDAIDFVGYRYPHGDDLYRLLWVECTQSPDDADWDCGGDIEFNIPEHVAWQIRDIIDNSSLDLFARELVSKLRNFSAKVV